MAWTTPRTWVAGAVLTAAQLNEQVRDNENYLKTQMDIADQRQVLDCVTSDTTITGVTSEQTLYTFTVPGGTLGTSGSLRLKIVGTILAFSGSTTIKVYYGTTVLATIVAASAAGTAAFWLETVLTANGAANSQHSMSFMQRGQTLYSDYNVAIAENSSGALDLAVKVTPGHNDNSITLHHAVLESVAAV